MPRPIRPKHPRDFIGKTWTLSDYVPVDPRDRNRGYKQVEVTLTGQQVYDLWLGICNHRDVADLRALVGADNSSSSTWNRATQVLRQCGFVVFDRDTRCWRSVVAS